MRGATRVRGRAERRVRGRTRSIRALALTLTVVFAACAPDDAPQDAASGETEPTASPTAGPSAYAPAGAERDAILEPLQTIFDALEAGDGELLRSVIAPGTVLSFAETNDGVTTTRTTTVDALAESIEGSEVRLIERMWDPVVLIQGPLATIWTPYDFYAGTELSHCGIDTATLLREDDGWTIVGLSWTREQPPRCELHPDGPPTG